MKARTEARRTAIIQAAADLFLEMGYERASMNELTKRLGGSKATLYGYFHSKEELFVAVVQKYATSHLADAVSDLPHGADEALDFKLVLTRFGENILRVLTNDGTALAVHRMVLAEVGRSDIGSLFYEAGPSDCINALSTLMQEATARGEIRSEDFKISALQFLALVTAEIDVRLYQTSPPPLTLEQIREMVSRAVNMFMNGARP
jgi:AcrR family transcriptional regulator